MDTRNRNSVARRLVRLALPALAAVCAARARDTWYVAVGGGGDGSSADSPTNSLQGAVDACDTGGTVWLAPGVYDEGGVAGYPSGSALTSRVAIARALTVRGVDGDPSQAVIRGRWESPGTNGPAAIRGVYMAAGARLLNLTVTNGATMAAVPPGGKDWDTRGGGICCQDTSAVISNCVIAGNRASGQWGYGFGGGAYGGTLFGCELTGNAAWGGGGARSSLLSNCVIRANLAAPRPGNEYPVGGGVSSCTVYTSIIEGNSNLGYNGGGAHDSTLYFCVLTNNHTTGAYGGAAFGGTLHGCILAGNSADRAGATYGSMLYNCLLTGNRSRGDFASAAQNCHPTSQ
jgi:hypothetical protein